jgi:acetoin utilization deacetylase AcuC-like enzyme
VFNDIAIANEWLRSTGQVKRAAIVDLDVHQGDGSAQIFQNEPDVLTLSLHCEVNFPFRKQQSKIDISLAEGVGDEEYLAALSNVLPRVFEFEPEIVFFQAGVDVLASDALGKLQLSPKGVQARDELVISSVKRAGLPLVLTIGGGYSKPIELTAEAHANTYRTALRIFDGVNEAVA